MERVLKWQQRHGAGLEAAGRQTTCWYQPCRETGATWRRGSPTTAGSQHVPTQPSLTQAGIPQKEWGHQHLGFIHSSGEMTWEMFLGQ